jgi:hypothetical protein
VPCASTPQPDKRDVGDFSAPLVLAEAQLIAGDKLGFDEVVVTIKHWLGIEHEGKTAQPCDFPDDLKAVLIASEPSLASCDDAPMPLSC